MRAFLVSLASFCVLVAVTGLVYVQLSASATDSYSTDSVRVGHQAPVDGRLGSSEGE